MASAHRFSNRAAINADGVSVWLDLPFEELLARVECLSGTGGSQTTRQQLTWFRERNQPEAAEAQLAVLGRQLAAAHPRWMAALGSHEDWQKNFKNFPEPGAGEVAKAFPWVPIGYREAFDAHLARIEQLLKRDPPMLYTSPHRGFR